MERAPVSPPGIRNLTVKVGVLLVLIPVVVIGLLAYALYARGVFEPWRTVVLLAANAEGVNVGTQVTLSGFPVGNVSRMELTETGEVRIETRLREKDARWLRTTSVFTLERPIFGAATIRATNPGTKDPPLPPGAVRPLVNSETMADISQVVARANAALQNIDEIINPQSDFRQSLAHLKEVTERMAGPYGLVEGLTGSEESAREVLATVGRVNALIGSLNSVSMRMDTVLSRTDERLFAKGGVMDEAQRSLAQLNTVLSDARDSLKQADAMLATAQSAAQNARDATSDMKSASTDLGALRAEVDSSIRRVNSLLAEINRRWPFARDAQVKLP
jgi:phospholipid/cholesterol/gamma-HCH transport system substrate-binding protein